MSKAWNSTHHGSYVFQTAFFFFFKRNEQKNDTDMYMNTDMYICNTHTDTCTCACTCVSLFFCCVVPCHVVCRESLLVGWLGVVWCCRHVVVVVVFVLVSWPLSLRRHRKIEERARKVMAQRSLNKQSEECSCFVLWVHCNGQERSVQWLSLPNSQ